MTQHIFLDVEAFGPPGIGRPFALGAVRFDMKRGAYDRRQWNIRSVSPSVTGEQSTLEWLSLQEPRVLAQMRNGRPFTEVWGEFLAYAYGDTAFFWADDWSDFAWLDFECRGRDLLTLRGLGSQYDSSPLVRLANPLKIYSEEKYGELVPHVAEHDAVSGALDLIAALNILGRELPQ